MGTESQLQFIQSLTLQQRALVLVATSQRTLLNEGQLKINGEVAS